MNYDEISKKVLINLGDKENITSYTSCITRLRVTVKNINKVNDKELRNIEGVLGLNKNGEEIQIVFGPGRVKKAYDSFDSLLISQGFAANDAYNEFEETVKLEKENIKSKRNSRFQMFMSKFSNIFVPLIPGFIAAGLLAGLGGLFKELGVTGEWLNYINVFNKSLLAFMYIMIGYNATVAFGGTGVIGGILAGLFKLTYVADKPTSGMTTFFGYAIDPRGGLVGVLIACILAAYIEKIIRKRFSWEYTDIITTPLLTMLITGGITFGIIMPVSFYLFGIMNFAFESLNGSPIGSGILATLFLPSVMLGIHQGFVPVYEGLIKSIGMNTLFPVLAMAGAGQVGASLALYVKADKKSKLRANIRGAIIPGLLGIGEPLIYGVTLPRVKPFFTSMLGGGVGGIYIGILAKMGYSFGLNTVFGSSGLLGAFAMTSKQGVGVAIALYLSALCVAYIAGFVITYFFGTKDVDLS